MILSMAFLFFIWEMTTNLYIEVLRHVLYIHVLYMHGVGVWYIHEFCTDFCYYM